VSWRVVFYVLLAISNLWLIIFREIPRLIESDGREGWIALGISVSALILVCVCLGNGLVGGGY
jgi:hypothetical protein